MTDLEQRKVAKEFAERWKDKGYEKGLEYHLFVFHKDRKSNFFHL